MQSCQVRYGFMVDPDPDLIERIYFGPRSNSDGPRPNSIPHSKQPMIPGYFKIGKVSCHIISNTHLFMFKIHVPAISMALTGRIRVASGHLPQNHM